MLKHIGAMAVALAHGDRRLRIEPPDVPATDDVAVPAAEFKDQPSKPFRDTHAEQVKLLGRTDLQVARLDEALLWRLIEDIYSQNDLFDRERMDNLLYNVKTIAEQIAGRQDRLA